MTISSWNEPDPEGQEEDEGGATIPFALTPPVNEDGTIPVNFTPDEESYAINVGGFSVQGTVSNLVISGDQLICDTMDVGNTVIWHAFEANSEYKTGLQIDFPGDQFENFASPDCFYIQIHWHEEFHKDELNYDVHTENGKHIIILPELEGYL